ncbi:hypothetical protein ACFSQ7_22390 [Paenibacillus rhizoplanae]
MRSAALNRQLPVEVCKKTEKVVAGSPERQPALHSYAYICKDYAAGGMWERVEEFDNEQLRWAFSLPVPAAAGVNRLYFSIRVKATSRAIPGTKVLIWRCCIIGTRSCRCSRCPKERIRPSSGCFR